MVKFKNLRDWINFEVTEINQKCSIMLMSQTALSFYKYCSNVLPCPWETMNKLLTIMEEKIENSEDPLLGLNVKLSIPYTETLCFCDLSYFCHSLHENQQQIVIYLI